MASFVQVGLLKRSTGFSPIKYNKENGDLVFFDDINGNCVMSEVTLPGLSKFDFNQEMVLNLCKQYSADGAILTDSGFIILFEDVADYYSFADLKKPTHSTNYDLEEEYEGDDYE